MAARVVNKEGLKADQHNFLVDACDGPNVAGVLGSAVACGYFLLALGRLIRQNEHEAIKAGDNGTNN